VLDGVSVWTSNELAQPMGDARDHIL
jgi:hypothetical protein